MPFFFFLFDSELVSEAWGEGLGALGVGGRVAQEIWVLAVPPAISLSRLQRPHLQTDLSGTCPRPSPTQPSSQTVLNTKWITMSVSGGMLSVSGKVGECVLAHRDRV